MSITLKVYAQSKIPSRIKTLKEFQDWLSDYLNKEIYDYQCVIDPYIQGEVMNWLNHEDRDNAFDARNGISGGCYGARDGSSHEGLTVYIDALQFPERWTDEDGDEIVNIKVLLNDHAECLEDLDPDSFLDACEVLGHEIKHDNTYNYLGHSSDDPHTLQDVDFKCIQTESDEYGCKIVIVKFHCGGDPRGNYTSDSVWKFKDAEDFYTVFNPSCYLKDQD